MFICKYACEFWVFKHFVDIFMLLILLLSFGLVCLGRIFCVAVEVVHFLIFCCYCTQQLLLLLVLDFFIITSYTPYFSSSSVLSHSRTADIPNQLVTAQLTLEKMHPIYLCINPSPVYPSIQSASHQWVSPTIRLSILQSIYFRLTKNAYATLC